MEILTAASQKGGTGKTSTAAALAQAAVLRGRKVLAVDLDPQANLSFALGADISASQPGSFELLEGVQPDSLVQPTEQGMDLIQAGWDLSTVAAAPGSARRLQNALEPLKEKYGLIIVDTPPTAGELQYNALQAATMLIIPVQADIYNMHSLSQTFDAALQFRRSNPALKLCGCVLTQYDGRSNLARQLRQAVEVQAASMGLPCLGAVRTGVAVKEAAALQKSLFEYAPKSKPAADFMALYDALFSRP